MNMKNAIIAFFLSFSFFLNGCVGTGRPIRTDMTELDAPKEYANDVPEAGNFHVRKRLIYNIAWNRIPVGTITAESGDIMDYRGYNVHVVRLVTESNAFLSRIYRVEDTYISYVDTTTLTSRRYEADRKEGNYRKHLIVEYDFDLMEAVYTNLTDGSVKRCPIEKGVHDPVSAICYFMTLSSRAGDKVSVTVNLNEKNYDLYADIGSVETIRLTRLGELAGFKVTPYAKLEGKDVRKGKAWIYASADSNRYPLFGVVIIPFGRITATLVSIEDI